jgi:hypothetical protein
MRGSERGRSDLGHDMGSRLASNLNPFSPVAPVHIESPIKINYARIAETVLHPRIALYKRGRSLFYKGLMASTANVNAGADLLGIKAFRQRVTSCI